MARAALAVARRARRLNKHKSRAPCLPARGQSRVLSACRSVGRSVGRSGGREGGRDGSPTTRRPAAHKTAPLSPPFRRAFSGATSLSRTRRGRDSRPRRVFTRRAATAASRADDAFIALRTPESPLSPLSAATVDFTWGGRRGRHLWDEGCCVYPPPSPAPRAGGGPAAGQQPER